MSAKQMSQVNLGEVTNNFTFGDMQSLESIPSEAKVDFSH